LDRLLGIGFLFPEDFIVFLGERLFVVNENMGSSSFFFQTPWGYNGFERSDVALLFNTDSTAQKIYSSDEVSVILSYGLKVGGRDLPRDTGEASRYPEEKSPLILEGWGAYLRSEAVVLDDFREKAKGDFSYKLDPIVREGSLRMVNRMTQVNTSAYDTFAIWIYGQNTDHRFSVTFWAPAYEARFLWGQPDNFTGWKRFVVPYSEFTPIGPADWRDVNSLWVSVDGRFSRDQVFWFDRIVLDRN